MNTIARIYAHTHTHRHAHMHTYTHTHIHTNTHTHIHTCTHARPSCTRTRILSHELSHEQALTQTPLLPLPLSPLLSLSCQIETQRLLQETILTTSTSHQISKDSPQLPIEMTQQTLKSNTKETYQHTVKETHLSPKETTKETHRSSVIAACASPKETTKEKTKQTLISIAEDTHQLPKEMTKKTTKQNPRSRTNAKSLIPVTPSPTAHTSQMSEISQIPESSHISYPQREQASLVVSDRVRERDSNRVRQSEVAGENAESPRHTETDTHQSPPPELRANSSEHEPYSESTSHGHLLMTPPEVLRNQLFLAVTQFVPSSVLSAQLLPAAPAQSQAQSTTQERTSASSSSRVPPSSPSSKRTVTPRTQTPPTPMPITEVYSVLQLVAVCCSVLQYVAVCCSVLQCVAVCCSVLPCVAPIPITEVHFLLQRVAVCCSVLERVAYFDTLISMLMVVCYMSPAQFLIRILLFICYKTLQHTTTRCNLLQHFPQLVICCRMARTHMILYFAGLCVCMSMRLRAYYFVLCGFVSLCVYESLCV